MRRGGVSEITIKAHLRDYLTRAPATYNAELKVLHRLAKFLQCEQLLESYKFASVDTLPQEAPTNRDVENGFKALVTEVGKAVYLFIATSGLRKGEILELKKDDVDFETRAVVPRHFTRTKRSGLTFISEEALSHLEYYQTRRTDDSPLLFPLSDRQWRNIWDTASKGAGCRITAKRLRLWHSVELGEKGVPDRYIDAFQGRAPRSTLAKHYTSHGMDRLKVVYDKAELKVLS